MSDINKPMDVPELKIDPPVAGKVRLSDDMQQTLALLTAMGADKRHALRCSESGVLNTTSARIRDIKHYTGVGVNDTQNGGDIECSECMVMGHPDNTGTIWVRPNTTATVNNAWPLAQGESVGFTLDNLKQLQMFMQYAGDEVIVAYTY